jgi:hypothetical protein
MDDNGSDYGFLPAVDLGASSDAGTISTSTVCCAPLRSIVRWRRSPMRERPS